MKNLFYDIYLPNISASMLMMLALICIILPYAFSFNMKKIDLKNKNITFVPNISKNIWNPILIFLVFNIFLYNIFILRFFYKYNVNPMIKYVCLFLICWSLLYTIFGFILMLDYIDRAYQVWDFKVLMWLLVALSFIRFTLQYISNPSYEIYVLYLYTLVCIALLILMWLITKEFKYYIIT